MSSAVGTKAKHDGQFRDWSFSSTARLLVIIPCHERPSCFTIRLRSRSVFAPPCSCRTSRSKFEFCRLAVVEAFAWRVSSSARFMSRCAAPSPPPAAAAPMPPPLPLPLPPAPAPGATATTNPSGGLQKSSSIFELVLNEWIISRRRSKALLQRCPLTDTSKSPTITAFSLLLSVCVAAARKLVMAPSSSATSNGGGFERAAADRFTRPVFKNPLLGSSKS